MHKVNSVNSISLQFYLVQVKVWVRENIWYEPHSMIILQDGKIWVTLMPNATLAPQARHARASGENLNYATLAPQGRQARPSVEILTTCWVACKISYPTKWSLSQKVTSLEQEEERDAMSDHPSPVNYPQIVTFGPMIFWQFQISVTSLKCGTWSIVVSRGKIHWYNNYDDSSCSFNGSMHLWKKWHFKFQDQ